MRTTGLSSDYDDPGAALEALAHWDELDPAALEQLASDPSHGPRLELLHRAEGWLRDLAHAERPASQATCPAADELYDYGRGPGYTPLPELRRSEIEAHVRHCIDCDLLVESLAQRPPLPLDLTGPVEDLTGPVEQPEAAPSPVPAVAAGPRSAWRWRVLGPALAAAAAVVVLLPFLGAPEPEVAAGGAGIGLPDAPLLRGEADDALLHPRGRLLAAPRDVALPGWLDLASLRRFELAPTDGAETYRIELFGHFGGTGGAFDDGRRLGRATSQEPTVRVAGVLGTPLPAGTYTWEAWAVVSGLDQRLGARDFEVVEDEALWRRVALLLGDEPAPQRLAQAVRLLHEAGFATDARALARELPDSPERDEFLGRNPGR